MKIDSQFKKGVIPHNKIFLDETTKKELINKYVFEKKSASKISREMGMCLSVILRILKEEDISIRSIGDQNKGNMPTPWNKGLTKNDDKRLKVNSGSFKKGLISWNRDKKREYFLLSKRIKFSDEDKKKIIHLFENDLKSVQEIGKIFNCTDRPIYRILKEKNIKINYGERMKKKYSGENSFNYKKLDDNEIISLYKEGMSTNEIGKLFNVNGSSVRNRLLKHNIYIRDVAFGIKGFLITDDGHKVKSYPEQLIDNFLFHHKIAHSYNQLVSNTKYRCDFYIPIANLYIEYWGLEGVSLYKSKMLKKLELYKILNLNLLSIFPKDNLFEKLTPLVEYSKSQNNLNKFIVLNSNEK